MAGEGYRMLSWLCRKWDLRFSWVGFLLIFTTSVEEYQTLKKEKNTKKKEEKHLASGLY
jgi:hypothetical protein